jgi:hypothetical protein
MDYSTANSDSQLRNKDENENENENENDNEKHGDENSSKADKVNDYETENAASGTIDGGVTVIRTDDTSVVAVCDDNSKQSSIHENHILKFILMHIIFGMILILPYTSDIVFPCGQTPQCGHISHFSLVDDDFTLNHSDHDRILHAESILYKCPTINTDVKFLFSQQSPTNRTEKLISAVEQQMLRAFQSTSVPFSGDISVTRMYGIRAATLNTLTEPVFDRTKSGDDCNLSVFIVLSQLLKSSGSWLADDHTIVILRSADADEFTHTMATNIFISFLPLLRQLLLSEYASSLLGRHILSVPEADRWTRSKVTYLLRKTINNLNSFCDLTKVTNNIVVDSSARMAYWDLHNRLAGLSIKELGRGDLLREAQIMSTLSGQLIRSADGLCFDRLPLEHTLAILAPFWVPLLVPVLKGFWRLKLLMQLSKTQ